MGHFKLIFVFLAFLTAGFILPSEQDDNLKISVYYETYCPDSINFVMNQLAPMMGEFNKYPDWLILELIPFGFAKETGHFKWSCQHGPKECAGNKLNACAIDELVTKQYNPLYMRLVNFIYCTMTADNQVKAAKQCAAQTGVNYKKLMKCYKGTEGDKLLEMYGNITASLQPPLNWVPTAVFNDKYNETENNEAQTNLYGVVCSYMPDECK
ncbi:GILT-like protein 1 [Homalodisca vitripennis]|uniref:GILT-like protein 1 n=1 Tax=Homalodisca vitripennis TaxID=197043 RepID=UPI001EEC8D44|nr:GILT-like protein 1 [Homalodisca vitripennis]